MSVSERLVLPQNVVIFIRMKIQKTYIVHCGSKAPDDVRWSAMCKQIPKALSIKCSKLALLLLSNAGLSRHKNY